MRTSFITLIKAISLLALISGLSYLVFVVSENQALAKFRSDFSNAAEIYQRNVIERNYDRLGPSKMLAVLETEYPLCHSEAHDLGRVVFTRTKDFAVSIQACGDGCTSGCFHGVLMEAFGHAEENNAPHKHVWEDEIAEKMNDVCSDPAILALHSKGKCVHGIGHAVTFLTNYDMQKSLDLCARFDNKPLEFYCAGGVFMEYSLEAKVQTEQSLHYPCDQFDPLPGNCYQFIMPKLLQRLGNLTAVEKECLGLDSFKRADCFKGLGVLNNLSVADNPQLIASLCDGGSLADQQACVEGATVKLSEGDQEKALAVCDQLNGELKSYCQEMVNLGAYSLDRSFGLYFKSPAAI